MLVLFAARRTGPILPRLALIGALCALLIVPVVAAQEIRTITFEEAVRIALTRNIQLRQSENVVELQSRNVFQQRMDFLPSLFFSTNGSRGSGFAQDQAGRNIQFTSKNLNGAVSAQVNVFNGFADVAALKEARHARDASSLDYDRSRQNVVFDVASNFLAYVNSLEQVRIQEENFEAQTQLRDQIQEFVDVGQQPISDLYQQQAQTAQAELQVLNARRTAQLDKMRLIQVLHLDPFGEYEFAVPNIDNFESNPQSYVLEDLMRRAFAERADIQAQEEQILAAREGIRIARSAYWPSVSLSGNYRSNFSPDADGGIFNQLDLNRGNSLGFNFQVPIFDRFTRGTQVQQAEVQYSNEVLALEQMQQQVALEVRQAYLDYEMAELRLAVTATQVQAAGQAVEAAEERYNVGAGTLVELTQARAGYVEAVSNQAQARFDYIFQSKLVDYYVGRLNPTQPLLP